jgi:ElaB/YqjD/DUF883 family membrane-anchored ribosome-binding protein
MNDMTAAHKDKLMADLRVVISDAEELLRLGAEQTGASATEWRARVEERISHAKLKLADLQDRVESPALEKQNAAAEQAHGGEKHVVIAGQSGLETPHEIEESSTHGQHDPNNAGPIQAGVDHGSQLSFKPL